MNNPGMWIGITLLAFGIGVVIWLSWIEPFLSVTDEDVETMANEVIAKHGPDAERVARVNHYHAHDRCESVEARRWKLVRRRLDAMRAAGRVY